MAGEVGLRAAPFAVALAAWALWFGQPASLAAALQKPPAPPASAIARLGGAPLGDGGGATLAAVGHELDRPWERALGGGAPRKGGPGDDLREGEAFLSSLAVPGLAQYRQGKRRWLLYAGAELIGAVAYAVARGDAHALRQDYRDFAWAGARMGFSSAPRVDGGFEYYERLTRWASSGRWDVDPGMPGLQPESDPTTYNGSVWALAMQIYGVDPAAPGGSAGYASALAHYREHGYGAAYLWAWPEGSMDQDHFGNMIARSDDRFRDARLALAVLVANHLAGAIDGFVTARLRLLPSVDASALGVSIALP